MTQRNTTTIQSEGQSHRAMQFCKVQKATDILQCPHLQISTERDGKPSCLECGLVQDQTASRYVRSITHYKDLIKQGIKPPPTSCLIGEVLVRQVCKYHERQMRQPAQVVINPKGLLYEEYLQDYLEFLKDNSDKCLPQKNRKRELKKIYGEHHKIISDYITLLLCSP
jgi:hypothetical protein